MKIENNNFDFNKLLNKSELIINNYDDIYAIKTYNKEMIHEDIQQKLKYLLPNKHNDHHENEEINKLNKQIERIF